MSVVESQGSLSAIEAPWSPSPSMASGVRMYGEYFQDYAAIYRTQQNVRTCVSFLARNLAQIGIKAYRRISATDRVELGWNDHQFARTLRFPNPATTAYNFIDDYIHDLGIYGHAFWLKLRAGNRVAVLRLSPRVMHPKEANAFAVETWEIRGRSGKIELPADSFVHIRLHNPDDPRVGLSPLETLRQTLAEDVAAAQYREHFWQNAARMEGVLQRPKDVDALSDIARQRLRMEFKQAYAGVANSGNVAILEEGMEYKDISFSAKDSQYLEARKLGREECAAAYHIPLPMVGILDHATYSNITEQHKNLYQDCLAPYTELTEQNIDLQLLPEFADVADVYNEFNIAEKMKGSFEEQTDSLSKSVGAPIMAVNEARSRLNLPRIDDPLFDKPVRPLNVLYAGRATEEDAPADPKRKSLSAGIKAFAERDGHVEKHVEVLTEFFERQRDSIFGKLGIKADGKSIDEVFDDDRWNDELKTDLLALSRATAGDAGTELASAYDTEFDVDESPEYLETNAGIAAENINGTTRAQLAEVLDGDDLVDEVKNVFAVAISMRVTEIADARVTMATSFGQTEAAKKVGFTQKTWGVTSGNPRASHSSMDGETVGIEETFSNGAKWPGDPTLPVEETAGCSCEVTYS